MFPGPSHPKGCNRRKRYKSETRSWYLTEIDIAPPCHQRGGLGQSRTVAKEHPVNRYYRLDSSFGRDCSSASNPIKKEGTMPVSKKKGTTSLPHASTPPSSSLVMPDQHAFHEYWRGRHTE